MALVSLPKWVSALRIFFGWELEEIQVYPIWIRQMPENVTDFMQRGE